MTDNAAENKLYEALADKMQSADEGDFGDVVEKMEGSASDGGFKNLQQPQPAYYDNSQNDCWTKLALVIKIFLVLLLVLVLIVQGVTLHQVISNNDSSDSDGTTGALSGDRTDPTTDPTTAGPTTDAPTFAPIQCSCDYTFDNQMVQQMKKSLDDSMALNNMLMAYIMNNTDVLGDNFDSTQDVVGSLANIVGTLANLETNSITTEVVVNDILSDISAVLMLTNVTELGDPTSCLDLKQRDPSLPSGYYHIHSQIMYCEMGSLCGNASGWTRVGFLDMSDIASNCPDGFQLRKKGTVRACGRAAGTGSAHCQSVKFEPNGIEYSQICGRVTGYQYGSPDALAPGNGHNDLDSWYVDGVSITQGYPREHVWTFINAYTKNANRNNACPKAGCGTVGTQSIQSFIGDNYFCESGNPNSWWYPPQFYTEPLWDGENCGTVEKACCEVPGIPWFNRTMAPSTDYIELRTCGDTGLQDEDTYVGRYEIYIM